MDRLRGLGNAIVPQIAEWIAERINAYESAEHNQDTPDAEDCVNYAVTT